MRRKATKLMIPLSIMGVVESKKRHVLCQLLLPLCLVMALLTGLALFSAGSVPVLAESLDNRGAGVRIAVLDTGIGPGRS